MSTGLATQLREGTQESHKMAESTAFMKDFLQGIIARHAFRQLIADFYFIYSALEARLEALSAHPAISAIYFTELNRKENLERDLQYYWGDNWRQEIKPSPATKVYIDRINEIADNEPELLAAHSYVRYMGDLSGGQALKHIVRSALDLPHNEGTAFYEFDRIPSIEAKRNFKERYRQGLESLPVDEEQAQRIVDEANRAFKLNRDIIGELDLVVT